MLKYGESEALTRVRQRIKKDCVKCGLCGKECRFLEKYGSPRQIADLFDLLKGAHRAMAYACSLCRLCTAVCPKGLDPAAMFLEMRRSAVQEGLAPYPQHRGILKYEKRGISSRYTWYGFPEGCDTVFFPGCTLTGTRPKTTLAFYRYLRRHLPQVGIVLDCCTKPSHDLGRQAYFQEVFSEMKGFLMKMGIRKVIVACPNCHQIFKTYATEMALLTAYEFMAMDGIPHLAGSGKTVTVHDPCALRFEEAVHVAVRGLLEKQGLRVQEMRHHGRKTLCCGEGGSAGCLAPELSEHWGFLRKKEAAGTSTFTYCAGCVNNLRRRMPAGHLLDLMFEPDKALEGRSTVFSSPLTYLCRLWVKKRLKKGVDVAISRERDV